MSENTETITPEPFRMDPDPTDLTIEQIIAEARPAERIVPLCLRGDLNARIQELDQQLVAVKEQSRRGDQSLADGGGERALAEEIEQLRAEMRAHQRNFLVRALPGPDWDALSKPFEKKGGGYDAERLAAPLIAASCVKPSMTAEQVKSLFKVLNSGQRDALFSAAWQVNVGTVDIPFSPAASATLRRPDSSQS